jgi:hypothetical protein
LVARLADARLAGRPSVGPATHEDGLDRQRSGRPALTRDEREAVRREIDRRRRVLLDRPRAAEELAGLRADSAAGRLLAFWRERGPATLVEAAAAAGLNKNTRTRAGRKLLALGAIVPTGRRVGLAPEFVAASWTPSDASASM